MAYRFLVVPIQDPRAAEAVLNGALRAHRVLSVERKWIDSGPNSSWAFCVDYLESCGGPPAVPRDGSQSGRDRVDYRERLSPDDFAVIVRSEKSANRNQVFHTSTCRLAQHVSDSVEKPPDRDSEVAEQVGQARL